MSLSSVKKGKVRIQIISIEERNYRLMKIKLRVKKWLCILFIIIVGATLVTFIPVVILKFTNSLEVATTAKWGLRILFYTYIARIGWRFNQWTL